MSGAQAVAQDVPDQSAGGVGASENQVDEVERVARSLGWKSRDELEADGKPTEKFVDPALFVARTRDPDALLAARNSALMNRLDRLENRHSREMTGVLTKLNEATETVGTVTKMLRTADERAFERARAELKAERDKAVETGDTAEFRRLDSAIDELDKSKPAAAAPPPARNDPPSQTSPQNGQLHPDVQAWIARNTWYDTDMEMRQESDAIHQGLLVSRPDVSPAQRLGEVERRMKVLFPDRVGVRRTTPPPPAADPEEEEEPAGRAAVVTPSSGAAPRQPRSANRRTFDTMPKESKDAFEKYKRQLEGKGEPLTKEEWSREYWAQFVDDGT